MADLYALVHHLKRCPPEFLQTSVNVSGEKLHTDALLTDVYRKIYGDFTVPDAKLPSTKSIWALDENQVLSLQIGCWFFSHNFFSREPGWLPKIHSFLSVQLAELGAFVNSPLWVEDEDRAEEFVRLALDCLDILPDGESFDEAADRFDALSTLKRHGVLKQTNASLQRIKDIRRKMAEKKAQEAANVYGRE